MSRVDETGSGIADCVEEEEEEAVGVEEEEEE